MAVRIRSSMCGIALGPQTPMPASLELLSGWARLTPVVASPVGAQAQSGWALNVSDAGLKCIGLIQRPSFIGAIASRTAANVASGKRGAYFEPGTPSQRG